MVPQLKFKLLAGAEYLTLNSSWRNSSMQWKEGRKAHRHRKYTYPKILYWLPLIFSHPHTPYSVLDAFWFRLHHISRHLLRLSSMNRINLFQDYFLMHAYATMPPWRTRLRSTRHFTHFPQTLSRLDAIRQNASPMMWNNHHQIRSDNFRRRLTTPHPLGASSLARPLALHRMIFTTLNIPNRLHILAF